MPDLTAGGKPVDARSQRLAVRRLELEIANQRTQMLRWEIEIEEARDNIERRTENIAATEVRIKELEAQIAAKTGGPENG